MDERVWVPMNDYKPSKLAWCQLGWFCNGRLEHTEKAEWMGDHWSGYYTPTHWRPAETVKAPPK